MIVVTNRIPVAKGHEIDFEDRFRNRVHLVDQAPGFIRNEVHRPRPVRFDHESGEFVNDEEAEGYYEVKTWWHAMDDFVAWTRSKAFAEAHANRAPKDRNRKVIPQFVDPGQYCRVGDVPAVPRQQVLYSMMPDHGDR